MIEFMMPLPMVTRTMGASINWTFGVRRFEGKSQRQDLESCLSVFVGCFFK